MCPLETAAYGGLAFYLLCAQRWDRYCGRHRLFPVALVPRVLCFHAISLIQSIMPELADWCIHACLAPYGIHSIDWTHIRSTLHVLSILAKICGGISTTSDIFTYTVCGGKPSSFPNPANAASPINAVYAAWSVLSALPVLCMRRLNAVVFSKLCSCRTI